MQDLPEFNISFVKLVEQHPCLYNNTDEDYYRAYVQDKSWETIARTIGKDVSVKDCKSRWRNLRGRFTKHLKSFASSDPAECHKRPYYLAEYLSFLLPFTKLKRPLGENDAPDLDDSITRFLEIDSSISDNNAEGGDHEPTEEIEFKYQPIETDRCNRVGPSPGNTHKRDPPIREKYRRMDQAEQYCEENRLQHAQNTIDYSDSDVLFLMSLLPDLKRMDDCQKRKFKIGILRLGGEVLNEFPAVSLDSFDQRITRCNTSSSNMSPDSGIPRPRGGNA